MRTRLVTNGALYRDEKYRELFDLVDTLDISFRTVDDMEVQQVQEKLTFDEYLDRVVAAVDLRAAIVPFRPHSKRPGRIPDVGKHLSLRLF